MCCTMRLTHCWSRELLNWICSPSTEANSSSSGTELMRETPIPLSRDRESCVGRQEVGGGSGCRRWEEGVVAGCGRREWLQEVGGGSGCRMWEEGVVAGGGRREWLQEVGGGSGCRMWEEGMVCL